MSGISSCIRTDKQSYYFYMNKESQVRKQVSKQNWENKARWEVNKIERTGGQGISDGLQPPLPQTPIPSEDVSGYALDNPFSPLCLSFSCLLRVMG